MVITNHDCHVCRSGEHVFRRYARQDLGSGELYTCSKCLLAFFVSNGATPEPDNDYWQGAMNLEVYSQESVVSELERKYVSYLERLKREGLAGGRLLDVGCGNGIFMQLARKQGFQPSGIDISDKAVQQARVKYDLDVQVGSLEEVSFEPRSFQIITLWDVIEHVQSPRRLIKTAYDLLDEKGILVLETPDQGALIRKMIALANRVSFGTVNVLGSIYYPDHRWYFSRRALAKLLLEVGVKQCSFYRQFSMLEKSKGKRKADRGRLTPLDRCASAILEIMKRMPFLGNKIVVFARKD